MAVAVNVTVHEPEARVHVVALKLPVGPVSVQVTVPVGVVAVPVEVSATVAVQAVALPTTVVEDLQTTVVLVVLGLTVIEAVPELIAWIESPP